MMSHNKLNLQYFFLFLLVNITFCSCSKDSVNIDDIVPYRKIDVELNLTYHNELTNNTAIYFDDVYGVIVGYNNHGIFVFRSNDEYFAYDATCTHDVESDEHVILNDPDDDDEWNAGAKCPVCNSEFLIPNGAYPIDGSVAKYPLKEYKTSLRGNSLRIYN